jgi:hypothetical protein
MIGMYGGEYLKEIKLAGQVNSDEEMKNLLDITQVVLCKMKIEELKGGK